MYSAAVHAMSLLLVLVLGVSRRLHGCWRANWTREVALPHSLALCSPQSLSALWPRCELGPPEHS